MIEIQYYVVDTETTGLSSKIHEINEFSIIRCKDKVNLFSEVKCERPESASIDALRITNKTPYDLLKGIQKKEACNLINKFLNEDKTNPNARCIIGHNIAFDRKFLFSMFEECDMIFPANLWLDTIDLTRNKMKENNLETKGKLKLAQACSYMNVKKVTGEHQAKADSRNTYFLWKSFDSKNYLKYIKNVPHKEETNELLEESDD